MNKNLIKNPKLLLFIIIGLILLFFLSNYVNKYIIDSKADVSKVNVTFIPESGETNFVSIILALDSSVPEDQNIDAIDIRVSQEGIYLYLEPGIDVRVGYLLTNRSGQNTRVESDYGHYDAHDQEIIKIESWARPDSFPAPRVCFELLKRGIAKLYVTFIIRYWDAPEEYDASYFADIARGERP